MKTANESIKKTNAYQLCQLVNNANNKKITLDEFRNNLEKLFKQDVYNINHSYQNGWTPMHYACKFNNLEIIKILLDFNADLYTNQTSQSKTPIMLITNIDVKNNIESIIPKPIEEFVINLILNIKQENQELETIAKEDIDSLKERYGFNKNLKLNILFPDKLLKQILSDFTMIRINYYKKISDILTTTNPVDLIDTLYKFLWIHAARIKNQRNIAAKYCNKNCNTTILPAELNFVFDNTDNFYQLGLNLLEEHISLALKFELEYTTIISIQSQDEINTDYDAINIKINIKGFFNDIYQPEAMRLMDFYEQYTTIDQSTTYNILHYSTTITKEIFANLGKIKSTEFYSQSFSTFAKSYNDLCNQCNLYEEYEKQISLPISNQSSIPTVVRQESESKDLSIVTKKNKIQEKTHRKESHHKITNWKEEVQKRRNEKYKLQHKSVLSELTDSTNTYLSYAKGCNINAQPYFYSKEISNILSDILDMARDKYTIKEIQNLIISLKGNYKLSKKNHLIYFIPDLYAKENNKYLTNSCALPKKSNSKNDQNIGVVYISEIRKTLVEAGFDVLHNELKNNITHSYKI